MLRRAFFTLLILTILVPAPFQRPVKPERAAAASPGLWVENADQTGVTLVLDTPVYSLTLDPAVGLGYQRLSVPDYSTGGKPGEPALPQMNALLAVPPGARITIEVLDEEIQAIPGEYRLAPVPGPAPLQEDLTPGELAYQPDLAVYAADGPYPAAPARLLDVAWLRDQRVVRVALSPFQYNPGRGTLVWRPHLRVRVTFTGGGAGSAPGAGPTGFESLLQGSVLNYEQARSWRGLPETPVNSLFSTPLDGETRYKIVVDQDGLYRITYADFLAAGVPVDGDPRNFALSSQGQDVAIQVTGETDGSFDPGDSLLFYGQRFRGDRLADLYAGSMADWLWLCGACELDGIFEKYTDENAYWLSMGSTEGLRMSTVPGDPENSPDPTPAYYTATVHAEQSRTWFSYHFSSEDTWFWQRIQPGAASATRTYTTTLTALASASVTATLRAEVVSRSENAGHHTQFYLNGATAPLDDAFWNGRTNHKIDVPVPQADLLEGVNALDFVVRYNGLPGEDMYFNWYAIDYARQFEAEGDQLTFAHDEPGTWKYQAAGFDSGAVTVLDLTYPLTPTRVLTPAVQSGGGGYTATFVSAPGQGARYFLSGAGAERSVKSITPHTPQDLSIAAADYVFITPQVFYTATQTLAAYRAAQGLSTLVVTVEELYDQFNFGIYHPIAIKNFLAYTFANWSAPPTYALLVGGGHWNLKGYEGYDAPPIYMPPNLAFVDPWQGEVDSANLLAAVVGEDILADVLIGRLPADSTADLEAMIGKTLAYETAAPAAWQENVVFAVDDTPDSAGDFVALAQGLMGEYLDPSPYFQGDPIYLNDYDPDNCGTPQPPTRLCPNANHAITTTLNITGALLVNYIGHASVNRWAHEKMFVNEDIPWLNNGDHLPVLLSMACLDGYWIHPEARPSLVVEMVTSPDKGGVAAFAATGLGVATGHDYLQSGFFSSLFDDGVWTLGAAAQNGKINLFTNSSGFNNDLIHTFTVFGDPALQILNPYGLSLAPGAQAAQGFAGTSVVYDFQVTNSGVLTDTYAVAVSGNTWPTTPSLVEIPDLAPGAAAAFSVQVDIPAGESGWEAATMTVTSQGDSGKTQAATLTTFTEAEQIYLPSIHR